MLQTQISILEILAVFLWLKLSSSLTLNKIEPLLKLPGYESEKRLGLLKADGYLLYLYEAKLI
ncbi:MAG: hypothetical protein A2Y79_14725 [Deltaproteobacteria bacterium RBG_13_43_22]|nr:MAG: hypothetical protein A2Y79_14725 [Deltaproteobacteria bacterium RBG_13_43_22]